MSTPTTPNRWSLFELSATYCQNSDCNDLADPGQELKITAESNGLGQFLTLSTQRWALSGPAALQALLADFIGRGAGLPLEQVAVATAPEAIDLQDTDLVEPSVPAFETTYLCDACGHDGGLAFEDCTQPGCKGMYLASRPAMGPHRAEDYGFGKPAGPYPVEAIDMSKVRAMAMPPAPVAEPAPLTHIEAVPAVKKGGVSRSGEPLRFWTASEDAQLKQDYPTTPNKQLAEALNRSEKSVLMRAGKLKLTKAPTARQANKGQAAAVKVTPSPKASPVAPALPKLADSTPKREINAGLENKLMKMVDKLGMKKLQNMDEHDARQALKLLTDNRGKLEWVPGAARLLERLSGYFSLPVTAESIKLEGSQARA